MLRKSLLPAMLAASCFFAEASMACNNPKEMPEDNESKYIAYGFPKWEQVSDNDKKILSTMFAEADLKPAYETWAATKNEQAASFFGIMKALSLIEVNISGTTFEPASNMVRGLIKAKGDRIVVSMDPTLFNGWRERGALYKVGKETGKVGFSDGGTMGGSLHCGYDIQGYTQRKYEPSVQWNFNVKNSTADIDMDGHKPTWGGIIPNPSHLTYRNSDVRFWFSKYTKKFGDPGFQVKERPKTK
jgi:hypothetical protein